MTERLPAARLDARQSAAPTPGRAGWWIAGGLALGVTAAVLMPRRSDDAAGAKGLSRGARAALGLAGEVGLAIAVRALSNAGSDEPHEDTPSAAVAPAPVAHGLLENLTTRFSALDGPALSRLVALIISLPDRLKSR